MKKLLILLILSFLASALVVWLAWIHHRFVTGLNPFLGSVILLIVGVCILKIVSALIKNLRNRGILNFGFSPAMLFTMGCMSFFISGILTYNYFGNKTMDIHLHDTFFVIAHFNTFIIGSVIFAALAIFYYCLPIMTGREWNDTMVYLHFWISFIGGYFIFWPSHVENLAGMPRRYLDYSAWNSFPHFESFNRFLSIVIHLVIAAQLLFVFNVIYSSFKGRRTIS